MNRTLCTAGLVLIAGAALAAPSKPRPATSLQITNARGVATTTVEVQAGGQFVSLDRPLTPQDKGVLKLPKVTGCTVALTAAFLDDTTIEVPDLDICREKGVRLTD